MHGSYTRAVRPPQPPYHHHRQVYRGLDVGSAKPPPAALRAVRHHLVDILPFTAEFSAGDFCDAAWAATEDVLSRGKARGCLTGPLRGRGRRGAGRGRADGRTRACHAIPLFAPPSFLCVNAAATCTFAQLGMWVPPSPPCPPPPSFWAKEWA